ncbi:probable serine/threonine-protein kinase clkA [Teleopsis dalmanni]|uniref:probable serine/threonine-protein kinase clkA n=1 Tax=Teleopsis dalmanni TaxID=139649 RepID=UPI0018CE85BB|nr:probable serine/threonine-protein kinase clkA [Teleopsis dalmanni]
MLAIELPKLQPLTKGPKPNKPAENDSKNVNSNGDGTAESENADESESEEVNGIRNYPYRNNNFKYNPNGYYKNPYNGYKQNNNRFNFNNRYQHNSNNNNRIWNYNRFKNYNNNNNFKRSAYPKYNWGNHNNKGNNQFYNKNNNNNRNNNNNKNNSQSHFDADEEQSVEESINSSVNSNSNIKNNKVNSISHNIHLNKQSTSSTEVPITSTDTDAGNKINKLQSNTSKISIREKNIKGITNRKPVKRKQQNCLKHKDFYTKFKDTTETSAITTPHVQDSKNETDTIVNIDTLAKLLGVDIGERGKITSDNNKKLDTVENDQPKISIVPIQRLVRDDLFTEYDPSSNTIKLQSTFCKPNIFPEFKSRQPFVVVL